MIKTEDLKNDLIKIKNDTGELPSKSKYDKYGNYHVATICRRFGSWNNALKEIFGEVVKEKPPLLPVIECINCGEKTKNPKFCTASCAATYNNKSRRKNPIPYCKGDGCDKITYGKTGYCKKCRVEFTIEQYAEKTIQDLMLNFRKNRYQEIRNHAHRVADFHSLEKNCPYCKGANHFDLCHIQSIGDFDKDTKLSIVNHVDNLIYLCKNHHWDLDHGFLTIKK